MQERLYVNRKDYLWYEFVGCWALKVSRTYTVHIRRDRVLGSRLRTINVVYSCVESYLVSWLRWQLYYQTDMKGTFFSSSVMKRGLSLLYMRAPACVVFVTVAIVVPSLDRKLWVLTFLWRPQKKSLNNILCPSSYILYRLSKTYLQFCD